MPAVTLFPSLLYLNKDSSGRNKVKALLGRALFLGSLSLLGACATQAPDEEIGLLDPAQPSLLQPAYSYSVEQAEADYERGHFSAARHKYIAIVSAEPENQRARIGLADTLMELSSYSEALEIYNSLSDHPDYAARALVGQGVLLLAKENTLLAKNALDRASALAPNDWRLWNAMGQLHDYEEAWSKASAAYQKSLDFFPSAGKENTKAIILHNIGTSHLWRKDYHQALAFFDQANTLAPSLRKPKDSLRLTLALLGRYDEATANASATDQAIIFNDAGYAAMMNGDYAIARSLFLSAMEKSPSFHEQADKNLKALEELEKGKGSFISDRPN